MPTTPPPDLSTLPSQYDHAAAQAKWYPIWEERGYFHADPHDSIDGASKPSYSIVIPPPNVTGALHLGHALNNTLQDILCRMKRMQGFNVLWMPGTDHAGIATQAVVERRLLEEEKLSRHDLGREKLVERIWEWKEQYEKRILGQLKQLGASCDWQRTRFTLDDQCARAVRETFFKLFKDNKIYRGKRLVNWDTFLQTAVSDDEVFHEVKKGHFWHFKYPVIDPQPGEPTHVTIATTRPETMLGDTAVAVHPDPAAQLDKVEADLKEKLAAAPGKEKEEIQAQIKSVIDRRQAILPKLVQLRNMAQRGVKLKLPLTDREIPLIADIWAKPELGSGCVKITPAHDANDYEVWQRSISGDGPDIGAINILNTDGTLNDNVPEKYRGLSMKQARKEVVADLANDGFHDPETDVEDREIDLAHSDRSKTPIEPFLADQWFVKMDELAQSAMDAVADGRVKIIPDRYAKGYQDWLSEKRDWPIGRQLWWGHRIPVWTLTLHNRSSSGEDLAETRNAFMSAWKGFIDAFDIANDISITPTDHLEVSYYVCIRSKQAEESFNCLYGHADNTALVNSRPQSQLNFSQSQARENVLSLALIGPQEEDVLDTWFSSALWPHSTLGWPEKTPELEKFYPTSTLITSRDIITLWVARMVLTGLYNMDEVPFSEVYIHPKILDGYGETMSKSKGNGVDPLDVIEKFGADALRFGIAYLTTETQDVRMPVEFECPNCQTQIKQTKKNRVLPRIECDKCKKPFSTQWARSDDDLALPRGAVVSERFELGRNFCNKLWNASRFSLMNLEGYEAAEVSDDELLLEDRWLLSRLATVTGKVTEALEEYRYADAARELYHFAWDDFCSFYVEMVKARFAMPEQRAVAQRVLAHVLDSLLRLLHPMIPFLTEEVWHLLGSVANRRGLASPPTASESVCTAPWPKADAVRIDTAIEQQFAQFQAVLGAVRETRMGQNIPPKEAVSFSVNCDAETAARLEPMQPYFQSMARATATAIGPDATAPEQAASKPLSGMEVHVDISDFFDAEAETKRLTAERDNLTKFTKSLAGKLSNENFVSRAPAEVVQSERDKLAAAEEQLAAVETALAKL
ncbi:MAG: valine--tRNA ligase [Planctomycetes bacterium]|nr:valine--tRNA ligase [Planctomycetota bacterium]